MRNNIIEIAGRFDFESEIVEVSPFGNGHINNTYIVDTENGKRYVLQRINDFVFKKPLEVMENIFGITEHLEKKFETIGPSENLKCALKFIRTKNKKTCTADNSGKIWRSYEFVDGNSFDVVDSQEIFKNSGKSFGDFFKYLSDYPADTLNETIVDFHNTPARLQQLNNAIEKDEKQLAKSVEAEIAFIRAREKDAYFFVDLQKQGEIPIRVTHNDTKLNNVLMDKTTNKGICVIDLDTVMPGFIAFDFGDTIRYGANNCDEDEPNLEKCNFDIDLFTAYVEGFLECAGKSLTKKEVETLVMGAKVILLEQAIRFLTDYLNGDIYYKVHREGQNLDRTRTQLKLISDMERDWETLENIVETIAKKYT